MNAILRLQPPLLVTFGPPCVQRKTEKASKTDNFFATFRQFLYSPGKKNEEKLRDVDFCNN